MQKLCAFVLVLLAAGSVRAGVLVSYDFSDGNASSATNGGSLGAGMNGTVTGGSITSSPFSPDNNALLLGGNNGNGISMPNGYDFGAAFTVEALVRLDVLQGTTSIIFDDFGGPGVLLTVDTGSGALRMAVSTVDNGTIVLSDPGAFGLGVWRHVAGVYDGSEVRLYVDGQVVASVAATGVVQNAGVTPNVGVESDGTGFPFKGAIDDFRIHDMALGVSEFNGGNTIPVPEPGTWGLLLLGASGFLCRRRARG